MFAISHDPPFFHIASHGMMEQNKRVNSTGKEIASPITKVQDAFPPFFLTHAFFELNYLGISLSR